MALAAMAYLDRIPAVLFLIEVPVSPGWRQSEHRPVSAGAFR
jgi:hypothetical protein